MVSYQAFVSLVFEIARERGWQVNSLQQSQEVLSVASELWGEFKSDPRVNYRAASPEEARNWIEANA